jgi:MOSC domain-containing protein
MVVAAAVRDDIGRSQTSSVWHTIGRMDEPMGRVAGLRRYPVKSMQGETLDSCPMGERGLAGDRGWAVIDVETGRVVSAKRPKMWGAMLECAAAYVTEPGAEGEPAPVRITLPGGRELLSDDPDRDRRLSEALGRSVTLQGVAPEGATYELSVGDLHGLEAAEPDRMTEAPVALFAPPGTFFDAGTLHLLTTATLERFAALHADGQWDVRRFRPNVVVVLDEAPTEGFPENGWVGRSLQLGEAQAAVLAPMPRCVMTTLPQGDLKRDPLILRTIAEHNRRTLEGYGDYACAGVLANVSVPGAVAVGDPVSRGAPL